MPVATVALDDAAGPKLDTWIWKKPVGPSWIVNAPVLKVLNVELYGAAKNAAPEDPLNKIQVDPPPVFPETACHVVQ